MSYVASEIDKAYDELFPDVLPENEAAFEESKERSKFLFKEGWNLLIGRDEEGNVVVCKKKECDLSEKEN